MSFTSLQRVPLFAIPVAAVLWLLLPGLVTCRAVVLDLNVASANKFVDVILSEVNSQLSSDGLELSIEPFQVTVPKSGKLLSRDLSVSVDKSQASFKGFARAADCRVQLKTSLDIVVDCPLRLASFVIAADAVAKGWDLTNKAKNIRFTSYLPSSASARLNLMGRNALKVNFMTLEINSSNLVTQLAEEEGGSMKLGEERTKDLEGRVSRVKSRQLKPILGGKVYEAMEDIVKRKTLPFFHI